MFNIKSIGHNSLEFLDTSQYSDFFQIKIHGTETCLTEMSSVSCHNLSKSSVCMPQKLKTTVLCRLFIKNILKFQMNKKWSYLRGVPSCLISVNFCSKYYHANCESKVSDTFNNNASFLPDVERVRKHFLVSVNKVENLQLKIFHVWIYCTWLDYKCIYIYVCIQPHMVSIVPTCDMKVRFAAIDSLHASEIDVNRHHSFFHYIPHFCSQEIKNEAFHVVLERI